jgi:RNA polymerase sigma-70 factor (ECF subfamily)
VPADASDDVEPEDDAMLTAAVARGDGRAFARLVDRHLDRVLAVARRFAPRGQEAEDIAQETFLRLWTEAGRYRPEKARLGTWLYRIAANLCLDAARRPHPEALDAAPEPVDERPGAEDALAQRQQEDGIGTAIAALPERQRMAVTLFYSGGLGNAEIAAAMDLSTGAVESLLVRARRSLRRNLEPATGATTATDGGRAV